MFRRYYKLSAIIFLTAFCLTGSTHAEDKAISQGKTVYDKWCMMCHGKGFGMGATATLQEKYKGALPALLEKRTDLSPEYIRFTVRNLTPGMPPFRPTEVTDKELDSLIAYLTRNNPR